MSNFPWPVITDDPETSDYPGSIINLQAEMAIEASADGIRVLWAPSTGADFINRMLADGQACWVVEFNCPKTLFMRRLKIPHQETLNELLSFNEVRGDVQINVYIQSATNIDGFRPQGVPQDLAALEFSLRGGDIIGSGKKKILADPDYLMAPGMRSIFKIRPAGPNDGNAVYRCSNDGDYFTIVLNKTLYDQFHRARMSANPAGKKAASGIIVLPPLALQIRELSALDSKTADLTMAQKRLLELLESSGITNLTPSSPHLEAAIQLLEKSNVLTTCFDRIGQK